MSVVTQEHLDEAIGQVQRHDCKIKKSPEGECSLEIALVTDRVIKELHKALTVKAYPTLTNPVINYDRSHPISYWLRHKVLREIAGQIVDLEYRVNAKPTGNWQTPYEYILTISDISDEVELSIHNTLAAHQQKIARPLADHMQRAIEERPPVASLDKLRAKLGPDFNIEYHLNKWAACMSKKHPFTKRAPNYNKGWQLVQVETGELAEILFFSKEGMHSLLITPDMVQGIDTLDHPSLTKLIKEAGLMPQNGDIGRAKWGKYAKVAYS